MKTMEINELISKLKEYDGELTVKVWSGGAEKPYPISNVAAGTTCAYIGVDDRNLVDLSKIWHDASEEPIKERIFLAELGTSDYGYQTFFIIESDIEFNWSEWVEEMHILRWAYVKDLLPKGGKI